MKEVKVKLTPWDIELLEEIIEKRGGYKKTSIGIVTSGLLSKAIRSQKDGEDVTEDSEIDKHIKSLNAEIEEYKKRIEYLVNKNMTSDNDNLLDDSADIIIEVLDPIIQKWIKEVCQHILFIPKWQLIAGHLRLAHDRGEMVSPALDPMWESIEATNNLKRMAAKQKNVCPFCKEEFSPARLGQLFCCNGCSAEKTHSENCILYKKPDIIEMPAQTQTIDDPVGVIL